MGSELTVTMPMSEYLSMKKVVDREKDFVKFTRQWIRFLIDRKEDFGTLTTGVKMELPDFFIEMNHVGADLQLNWTKKDEH